jgi:hypothetical protein
MKHEDMMIVIVDCSQRVPLPAGQLREPPAGSTLQAPTPPAGQKPEDTNPPTPQQDNTEYQVLLHAVKKQKTSNIRYWAYSTFHTRNKEPDGEIILVQILIFFRIVFCLLRIII